MLAHAVIGQKSTMGWCDVARRKQSYFYHQLVIFP